MQRVFTHWTVSFEPTPLHPGRGGLNASSFGLDLRGRLLHDFIDVRRTLIRAILVLKKHSVTGVAYAEDTSQELDFVLYC